HLPHLPHLLLLLDSSNPSFPTLYRWDIEFTFLNIQITCREVSDIEDTRNNYFMVTAPFTFDLDEVLDTYEKLRSDDKLALLWLVYVHMGGQITPAAPGAAEPAIADGLYNQVKDLSYQDQLEVQRELVRGADTAITRQYGAFSENSKLLFWYRLAQGMETEEIVPMPDEYQMDAEARTLLAKVEQLEFQEQITFLRKAVGLAGSTPETSDKNII
ncbi:orange carotenoid protein N-terminal domain-containing protein, partial [Spirulina sp. CS-785/01]|uniref:orange carotenoid protein N-terminal domain-containing protein n=1 Tax=Spirulina sp. CS-785/01 TaxID=3021716 RepID=UPI00232FCA8D